MGRAQFVRQLILMAVSGLIGGASLVLLVPIINSLAGTSDSQLQVPVIGTVAIDHSTPLWALLLAFVTFAAFSAWLGRATSISNSQLQPRLVVALQSEAFRDVLEASWSFLIQQRRAYLMESITGASVRCGQAFQQLMTGIVAIMNAGATIVVALFVSPIVTVVALVGLVALSALNVRSIRLARRLGIEAGQVNRGHAAVVQDALASLRLVRAHDAAAVWHARLLAAFESSRSLALRQAKQRASLVAWSSWSVAAAAALLVLVASHLGVAPSSIVIVVLLIGRLANITRSLGQTIGQLAESLPAVSELTDLVAAARQSRDIPPSASVERAASPIAVPVPLVELRSVTFHYPDTTHGVHELTLAIPTGETTVLTGPSGSGKSTTADLVIGLLRPRSGTVLVEGTQLTPADMRWWRAQLAYVPQETVLIPGSLRDNLTWSIGRSVTDEECWESLEMASASFVSEMPGGLDALIGDGGLRMSGGERQRLTIARALLRKPRLLVLDEATSSLDDQTEAAVLDLLSTLPAQTTTLVIAHRASTIKRAQHLIRLERGRIAHM